MPLDRYREKRDFKKTPEPSGKRRAADKQALFVVQEHAASHHHFDFRLEVDGVLASWAVPKGPSMNPSDKRLAMKVEDHPLDYAGFEGTIPKGNYGAGQVIVWDKGSYMHREAKDLRDSQNLMRKGIQKGELKFVLLGKKLKGGFALVKLKDPKQPEAWLLIKEKDVYAGSSDVQEDDRSVISGKKLPAKEDPWPEADAMLAKRVAQSFDRAGWIFEPKWDGYRLLAKKSGEKVSLSSRNKKEFELPEIKDAVMSLGHDLILDGELIALDKKGKPDFHALQARDIQAVKLRYMVFDILYLDGRDLRKLPLSERRAILKGLLKVKGIARSIGISEGVTDKGKAFFSRMKKEGYEGMVAKDLSSSYLAGRRSGQWLKVKTGEEEEAIIVGYTAPRGSRQHIGALVLAQYDKSGALKYVGHSGGGFSEEEMIRLKSKLDKIKTDKAPFSEKVKTNAPVTWVKAKYVCALRFSEWTPEGRMRHPVYLGLRPDKSAGEVKREEVIQNIEVPLSHPEKIFWPKKGYTKQDLADYYRRIAPFMLPYLKDRPENLLRHPNGAAQPGFFHKDITQKVPEYVRLEKIWSESRSKEKHYLICDNLETLLYMVNLGSIEINPWNSRYPDLDNPDYLIIDIDPGGRPFSDVLKTARVAKEVLDLICAEGYPKTSGKSGLHIYIPLGARYSYDQMKDFALLLAQLINSRLPDITTLKRHPADRGGRLYVDYLQNRHGQTVAAPYSLRPTPEATVSTPLRWSEIKAGLDPKKFTMKTIFARLKKTGDLWSPVLGPGLDLLKATDCLRRNLGLISPPSSGGAQPQASSRRAR